MISDTCKVNQSKAFMITKILWIFKSLKVDTFSETRKDLLGDVIQPNVMELRSDNLSR